MAIALHAPGMTRARMQRLRSKPQRAQLGRMPVRLDLIEQVNAKVAGHLARRGQTPHARLELSRDEVNATHLNYADLIASAVIEVSDLSQRGSVIDIRLSAKAVTITGSNPISLPDVDLTPQAVVLDHAEAAGLPVRLAWEQCMGPQLMIELTPGGFTLSRAFRLARDPGRAGGP